ncbi:ATP-binding cassette domain-containing protein [Microcella frigidaquae]|uniref:ABC-type glutathione transport system ATPase component n=1 Tax=Microcella frigidaquae TaxID=424758 RepID=A0A840XDG9_9MICO|nr:ABC-type glutathione transport system ATPase component [Microcella frigidaquae]
MTESAVCARDLTLRYRSGLGRAPVTAIAGLSLDIAPGETLAVIGDAGSGKSTLARAIAGYTSRSVDRGVEIVGGALAVLGVDVRHLGRRGDNALALRVGYVPQDAGLVLDPHLTVAENVALPLFLRDPKFSRKAAGGIAAEAIDAMHLTLATMPKFPHELSRGQRQRVAIARALVLEPELLVADEATAGIDATVRGMILDHLAEVQRQRGFTAFVVSSEIGEVRRLAQRLAVLHRGGIVGLGAVDAVLDDPQHPYVHRLAELARTRA